MLTEVDGDGHADAYIVHNFFGPQLETGQMDGRLSLLLRGRGDGIFTAVRPAQSGLVVPEDAKGLAVIDLNDDGWPDFIVGINNGTPVTFLHKGSHDPENKEKPGTTTAHSDLKLGHDRPLTRQHMQILRGLYQVGGDMNGITWDGIDAGYNDGNTYVLQTPEGLILFDCGCGATLDQIEANMNYWDLQLDDVTHCILTHAHFDHAAAGHLLKKRGIEFISIGETADAVASGDNRCCGYLYHKTFSPFEVDRTVTDGEKFVVNGVKFETMHLPGHSQGCTAFLFQHEGKRIVVSGDVIGTLLAGDFGWSGSIDFDKRCYLESLKRFAQVDSDIMLPGHGMIYFHAPRRRVEQALNTALMEWR